MRAVLSVSLPEPLAAERSRLATETGRPKSDIVKESVSQYVREARFRGMRRQLVRRANRPRVTADDDLFRAVG